MRCVIFWLLCGPFDPTCVDLSFMGDTMINRFGLSRCWNSGHPFAGHSGRGLAGECRPEERAVTKQTPRGRTSELYHERFCRITEMPSFVVVPALFLLSIALAAVLLTVFWPLLQSDAASAGAMKRRAKPGAWAFAYAAAKGNLCGRVDARPELPGRGHGSHGARGVRRRRLHRIR
jgi:hypothetical protein